MLIEALSILSYSKLFEYMCEKYDLSGQVSWNLLLRMRKFENENKSVKEFLYDELK